MESLKERPLFKALNSACGLPLIEVTPDEIIELLKHNPTILYKNKDGETPLCIAKRLEYSEISEIISTHCDTNNIDYNSISPVSSENNLCENNSSNDPDSEYSEYSSMSSSICSSSSDYSS